VTTCDTCEHGRPNFDCRCGQDCCRNGIPEVVGLDLSLTCTGVAGYGYVERVTSTGHENATLVDRQTRLTAIEQKIRATLAVGALPELIVVEGPSYASKSGQQWDRAGLWWRVLDHLMLLDYPVAVVPPSVLKKYATGKGNASKQEVMLAASRRYPWADIVDDNTADAQVLYAMGCDWLGHQLASVPQVNRNALASVAWPEGVAA
jgi:crossover junction endodeoxyribonuclease RuvC